MKIVKPNAELMFAPNNDLFALKHLESVGRTCYKSENNITDDSCINFVSGIIKRGHEAVIEHYSFIYELNDVSLDSLEFLIKNLSDNGFNSYLRITYDKRPVVSGNVRAWRELFKWATKLGYRIPGYMKSFVYAYPLFFPEYKDSLFSTEVDEDYVFTPLSVAGLHGDIGVFYDTPSRRFFLNEEDLDRKYSWDTKTHTGSLPYLIGLIRNFLSIINMLG